ncbi:MAG: hypothetical protein HQL14_03145 [Candidatus Omnitrophica bacterium]|nr:hypothetical protein [Candidatus Omnitrophota bacterium]
MSDERLSPQIRSDIWTYVRKNGYVCYYTQMPLEMGDRKSPWFCVFDHWIPNNPNKIVLTSALFNEMKSDLSEREFWDFIGQLNNYKNKQIKIKKKKLKYWYRLNA